MDDVSARFWSDLIGRLSGPMTFRFILQPTMSLLQAWRDGTKDAKLGRPPYFWSLEHSPERTQLLEEGWRAVLRIILLGAVMDAIYQFIVFRWIYPVELIVIVLLLAFVPYVLTRGAFNRLARSRAASKRPRSPA